MMSRFQRPSLALSLALLLFACGDDAPTGPDAEPPDAAPPTASCLEAETHSDLEWIQREILNKSCSSFSVCHMGAAASAGGLNLESGMSEAAMVGVDSINITDWKLVVPGDPDNSYLMVILGDIDGPLTEDVGTMPFNNPILCQRKRDSIRRWITSLPAQ